MSNHTAEARLDAAEREWREKLGFELQTGVNEEEKLELQKKVEEIRSTN